MRRDDPIQPSAADLIARLLASRKALMDGIAGLDEEGFLARPGASQWSAAEVLAHLLASERVLAQQARAALAKEGFDIKPRTQDERDEEARAARRMAVPQVLHGLLAQRRDTLRLLEGLSSQQLARLLRHPQSGERSVAWLFQRAAEHEAEHAAQLEGLRARPAAQTP